MKSCTRTAKDGRRPVFHLIVLSIVFGIIFTGCSAPIGLKDSPLPKGGPQASPRHPPGDVNNSSSRR